MGTSTSRYVKKKNQSGSQKERHKRTRKKIEERKKKGISFDEINKLR